MTNPVETKINHAADFIEPSVEFSQKLWNQMRMAPRHEQAPKRVSRFVWVPALTVLGILVVMFLVAPQTVLAAVKGLLAYIPGVGFVEKDESTLYLEKPIVVEQDGYSLILDQVVADKNKVAIAYHMTSPSGNFNHCAYNENFLLWPDGKSNNPIGGGLGSDANGGITAQIDYFPLPEGMTRVSLKVSADPTEPGCAAPKEWIVPFTLGTEAPDVEFLPVMASDPAQTAAASPNPYSSSTDVKVQLIVDKYVELAEGFLLTGHIETQEPSWKHISTDASFMTANDARGNNVPLKSADMNLQDNEFALVVAVKDFTAPLTLHVNQLSILAYEEQGPSFSFDAGSDPQVDQSWKIEQLIEFAGKQVQVKEVKVVNKLDPDGKPSGELGYQLQLNSSERIDTFFDCQNQKGGAHGWGEAMPLSGTDFLFTNYFEKALPSGVVTCTLANEMFNLKGDWQLDWQPSATSK